MLTQISRFGLGRRRIHWSLVGCQHFAGAHQREHYHSDQECVANTTSACRSRELHCVYVWVGFRHMFGHFADAASIHHFRSRAE